MNNSIIIYYFIFQNTIYRYYKNNENYKFEYNPILFNVYKCKNKIYYAFLTYCDINISWIINNKSKYIQMVSNSCNMDTS